MCADNSIPVSQPARNSPEPFNPWALDDRSDLELLEIMNDTLQEYGFLDMLNDAIDDEPDLHNYAELKAGMHILNEALRLAEAHLTAPGSGEDVS